MHLVEPLSKCHRNVFGCQKYDPITESEVNPTYNKRHGKVLFRPPTPLKLQGLER